jgi:Spy/CpxP family protein refolding chaperone
MKKQGLVILAAVFVIAGFTTNGLAEPPDFDKPPTKEQKEKVRKRIETLKMWRLTKDLDLDEKTSAQLFPLLNKYDKKRAEIEHAMQDNMKELRESLREKREGQLRSILDRLEENHKGMQSIKDMEWEEMKKILTIEQQAKFVIFLQEFDREMRKIMAEARERRHERLGKDIPEKQSPQERK